MQKNPERKKEIVPEVQKPKGKRNRKPTACPDKIRAWNTCGICGSINLVSSGTVWCTVCGIEETYLIEGYGYALFRKITPPKCDCKDKSHSYKGVVSCMDCGAVCGPKCPVCGRKLWAKGEKKFCKGSCGYKVG